MVLAIGFIACTKKEEVKPTKPENYLVDLKEYINNTKEGVVGVSQVRNTYQLCPTCEIVICDTSFILNDGTYFNMKGKADLTKDSIPVNIDHTLYFHKIK